MEMSTTSKRKVSSYEDNDIVSWAMKIASPTGGQSIPMFDIYMAPGVAKTFIKQLVKVVEIKYPEADVKTLKKRLESFRAQNGSIMGKEGLAYVEELLKGMGIKDDRVVIQTIEYTDKETHQAMEAFIHNLNSMHSRAGRSMCA